MLLVGVYLVPWLVVLSVQYLLVEQLPLQIRYIDLIEIDDPESADPGRGEVHRRWRAQSTCPHTEHPS